MTRKPEDDRETRAGRLLRAVDSLRYVERPKAGPISRPAPSRVLTTEPGKGVPRAIRFPKETAALRQHVSAVQKRPSPDPTKIRIRLRPAPTEIGERTRPSLALRQRVAEARGETVNRTGRAMNRANFTGAGGIVTAEIETAADIGRVIRERRAQVRLSQSQLALAARTGRRFISELESGKPTTEVARVLSVFNALGLRLFVELQPDAR